MNLPDEIQSQEQLRGRLCHVEKRIWSAERGFIEALCLFGQGTGQIECQAGLIVQMMLEEAQHIYRELDNENLTNIALHFTHE